MTDWNVGDKVVRTLESTRHNLGWILQPHEVGEVVCVIKNHLSDKPTLSVRTREAVLEDIHSEWLEKVEQIDVKPSNPKDSIGVTKPPLSCIPCGPLFEIGAAMLDGSCKYGRHNYRSIGVRSSVYYDAMLRHIMRWWEGEEVDKDSGCLHLAHAAACAIILMDCPDVNDDRPPVVGNPVDRVAETVKAILGKYPDPKEPFVEKKS